MEKIKFYLFAILLMNFLPVKKIIKIFNFLINKNYLYSIKTESPDKNFKTKSKEKYHETL